MIPRLTHGQALGLLLGTVLALSAAIPAAADSPHFITAAASINGSGQLVCSFKEAGLGNTVTTEHITCSATATAVYACINGGSNHPKAANKQSTTSHVSNSGDFPVRNGSTSGTLTISPPPPGGFQPPCDPPMTVVLVSVSYTGITLTGAQGDTASVPDQSRVFSNL